MASTPPSLPENTQPLPFYRRTPFWVFIGLLLGVLIAFLFASCQVTRQPEPGIVAVPDELLAINKARIQGLQDELARMKDLMAGDICTDPLFAKPPAGPVSPDYHNQVPPPVTENIPGNAPSTNGSPPETLQAPAPAATPETVSALMDQATVFILSIRDDGVGMGSGFFVAPGIIATNRHVIGFEDAKILVGNKHLSGMHVGKLIAFSKVDARDYALIRVAPDIATKAPILKIAVAAKRTERVSAWGFPSFITSSDPKLKALLDGDLNAVPEVVYSEGVVSVVLEKKPPFIVHTASISQGNSGGPLIDDKGVVVGINTMIQTAVKDSFSQSGIALPGGDLVMFLQENNIPITTVVSK